MKKITLAIGLCLISMLSISCNSKDKCIQDFDEMVTDIELNSDYYTSEDWEMVEASYEDFLESIEEYQDELTTADYKEIGRITARYHKIILSMTSEALEYGIDASSSYMEGYMEEMGDGKDIDVSDEDYEAAMNDALKAIDKLYEEYETDYLD
ncbi:MAG: hypothetical protein MJZ42_02810 [Bacteroidales bacterium]|nr:hypothetical protein [Bacteroidales bacterium]